VSSGNPRARAASLAVSQCDSRRVSIRRPAGRGAGSARRVAWPLAWPLLWPFADGFLGNYKGVARSQQPHPAGGFAGFLFAKLLTPDVGEGPGPRGLPGVVRFYIPINLGAGHFGLLRHSAKTCPGKTPQGPWEFGGLT
jgi:hypothetical protein